MVYAIYTLDEFEEKQQRQFPENYALKLSKKNWVRGVKIACSNNLKVPLQESISLKAAKLSKTEHPIRWIILTVWFSSFHRMSRNHHRYPLDLRRRKGFMYARAVFDLDLLLYEASCWSLTHPLEIAAAFFPLSPVCSSASSPHTPQTEVMLTLPLFFGQILCSYF